MERECGLISHPYPETTCSSSIIIHPTVTPLIKYGDILTRSVIDAFSYRS